jgi:glycosyltransferase involved in cell wall biosynthesis
VTPSHYSDKKPILKDWQNRINSISSVLFGRNVFSLRYAIARLLQKEKIDIVYAQYGMVGVAMQPICKLAGVNLVVHFHGYDASIYKILEKSKEDYLKLSKEATRIIAVSNAMVKTLKDIGMSAEKILLAPYGANPEFFRLTPNFKSDTFLSVGRFTNKKAPHLTILAFKKVLEEFPNARLRMAGDGNLLEPARDIVQGLGIKSSVDFLGSISHMQVMNEMQNCLAIVQHSKVAENGDSEGTPNVVIEAGAAGLPVISTYHAGIPDVVINGETGLLVAERDVDGMAEAMKKVFIHRTYASNLGQNARKRVCEHFSIERYISSLRSII